MRWPGAERKESCRQEVGVEIGGTFTDIIAVDETGVVVTHKVSTTPHNPAIGSFQGISELAIEPGVISTFLHGSTIATNAVLERKGANTGLLTTRGFRDVLIIQRFDKTDSYNPFYKRPEPLVPRSQISEVTERLGPDGEELVPLNAEHVIDATRDLVNKKGVESLAICFLHAYLNPAHERQAQEVIRQQFPNLDVSLSSHVLPKIREYERESTTVISAYVKPIVDRYLRDFERHLQRGGFSGAFFVMQANGGVIPSVGARASPESMYLSGPAAGVVGAAYQSRHSNLPNLLTLDVGGTSTDVALVTEGRPTIASEGQIGGLPIALPIMDIVTIGAGGGSIAWRDKGGMLRVGPRSAGAQPGPACYGRGGRQPTLTDALVVIGLIPPDRFLGGRMPLDVASARAVVQELASTFKMPAVEMAESIVRIAVANITQATRLVSIRRGHDPRRYAICAYGGAGPLLAALVAEQLSVPRVVVPRSPGLFSAFGLLVSDIKRDFTQSRIRRLSTLPVDDLRRTIRALRQQAEAEFATYGLEATDLNYDTWLELRYEGQGFELPIQICDADISGDDTTKIRNLFNEAHLALYGHNFPSQDVVVTTYRVTVTVARTAPTIRTESAHTGMRAEGRVFWDGDWRSSSFHLRDGIDSGSVRGPAVISEDTATTFIPAGWRARVDYGGNLIIEGDA